MGEQPLGGFSSVFNTISFLLKKKIKEKKRKIKAENSYSSNVDKQASNYPKYIPRKEKYTF